MDEIKEQAQGGTESDGGLGVKSKSTASVNEEEGTYFAIFNENEWKLANCSKIDTVVN